MTYESEMFCIVPYKMYNIYVGIWPACIDGIDSANDQAGSQFAVNDVICLYIVDDIVVQ